MAFLGANLTKFLKDEGFSDEDIRYSWAFNSEFGELNYKWNLFNNNELSTSIYSIDDLDTKLEKRNYTFMKNLTSNNEAVILKNARNLVENVINGSVILTSDIDPLYNKSIEQLTMYVQAGGVIKNDSGKTWSYQQYFKNSSSVYEELTALNDKYSTLLNFNKNDYEAIKNEAYATYLGFADANDFVSSIEGNKDFVSIYEILTDLSSTLSEKINAKSEITGTLKSINQDVENFNLLSNYQDKDELQADWKYFGFSKEKDFSNYLKENQKFFQAYIVMANKDATDGEKANAKQAISNLLTHLGKMGSAYNKLQDLTTETVTDYQNENLAKCFFKDFALKEEINIDYNSDEYKNFRDDHIQFTNKNAAFKNYINLLILKNADPAVLIQKRNAVGDALKIISRKMAIAEETNNIQTSMGNEVKRRALFGKLAYYRKASPANDWQYFGFGTQEDYNSYLNKDLQFYDLLTTLKKPNASAVELESANDEILKNLRNTLKNSLAEIENWTSEVIDIDEVAQEYVNMIKNAANENEASRKIAIFHLSKYNQQIDSIWKSYTRDLANVKTAINEVIAKNGEIYNYTNSPELAGIEANGWSNYISTKLEDEMGDSYIANLGLQSAEEGMSNDEYGMIESVTQQKIVAQYQVGGVKIEGLRAEVKNAWNKIENQEQEIKNLMTEINKINSYINKGHEAYISAMNNVDNKRKEVEKVSLAYEKEYAIYEYASTAYLYSSEGAYDKARGDVSKPEEVKVDAVDAYNKALNDLKQLESQYLAKRNELGITEANEKDQSWRKLYVEQQIAEQKDNAGYNNRWQEYESTTNAMVAVSNLEEAAKKRIKTLENMQQIKKGEMYEQLEKFFNVDIEELKKVLGEDLFNQFLEGMGTYELSDFVGAMDVSIRTQFNALIAERETYVAVKVQQWENENGYNYNSDDYDVDSEIYEYYTIYRTYLANKDCNSYFCFPNSEYTKLSAEEKIQCKNLYDQYIEYLDYSKELKEKEIELREEYVVNSGNSQKIEDRLNDIFFGGKYNAAHEESKRKMDNLKWALGGINEDWKDKPIYEKTTYWSEGSKNRDAGYRTNYGAINTNAQGTSVEAYFYMALSGGGLHESAVTHNNVIDKVFQAVNKYNAESNANMLANTEFVKGYMDLTLKALDIVKKSQVSSYANLSGGSSYSAGGKLDENEIYRFFNDYHRYFGQDIPSTLKSGHNYFRFRAKSYKKKKKFGPITTGSSRRLRVRFGEGYKGGMSDQGRAISANAAQVSVKNRVIAENIGANGKILNAYNDFKVLDNALKTEAKIAFNKDISNIDISNNSDLNLLKSKVINVLNTYANEAEHDIAINLISSMNIGNNFDKSILQTAFSDIKDSSKTGYIEGNIDKTYFLTAATRILSLLSSKNISEMKEYINTVNTNAGKVVLDETLYLRDRLDFTQGLAFKAKNISVTLKNATPAASAISDKLSNVITFNQKESQAYGLLVGEITRGNFSTVGIGKEAFTLMLKQEMELNKREMDVKISEYQQDKKDWQEKIDLILARGDSQWEAGIALLKQQRKEWLRKISQQMEKLEETAKEEAAKLQKQKEEWHNQAVNNAKKGIKTQFTKTQVDKFLQNFKAKLNNIAVGNASELAEKLNSIEKNTINKAKEFAVPKGMLDHMSYIDTSMSFKMIKTNIEDSMEVEWDKSIDEFQSVMARMNNYNMMESVQQAIKANLDSVAQRDKDNYMLNFPKMVGNYAFDWNGGSHYTREVIEEATLFGGTKYKKQKLAVYKRFNIPGISLDVKLTDGEQFSVANVSEMGDAELDMAYKIAMAQIDSQVSQINDEFTSHTEAESERIGSAINEMEKERFEGLAAADAGLLSMPLIPGCPINLGTVVQVVATCVGGPLAGAVASLVVSLAQGQSLGNAVVGAVLSYATSYVGGMDFGLSELGNQVVGNMAQSFIKNTGQDLASGKDVSWDMMKKNAMGAVLSGAGAYISNGIDLGMGDTMNNVTQDFASGMINNASQQLAENGKVDFSWNMVRDSGISAVASAGSDYLSTRDFGFGDLGNSMAQNFTSSLVQQTSQNFINGEDVFSWDTVAYSAGSSLQAAGDYYSKKDFGFGKLGNSTTQNFTSTFLNTTGQNLMNGDNVFSWDTLTKSAGSSLLAAGSYFSEKDYFSNDSRVGKVANASLKTFSSDLLNTTANDLMSGHDITLETLLNNAKNSAIEGVKAGYGAADMNLNINVGLGISSEEPNKYAEILGLVKDKAKEAGIYDVGMDYLNFKYTGEEQKLIDELKKQGKSDDEIKNIIAAKEKEMYNTGVKNVIHYGVEKATTEWVSSGISKASGAQYNKETGKYEYKDFSADERDLFYGDKMSHFAGLVDNLADIGVKAAGIYAEKELTGSTDGSVSATIVDQKFVNDIVDTLAAKYNLDINKYDKDGKADNIWTKLADKIKDDEDKALLSLVYNGDGLSTSKEKGDYDLSLGELNQARKDLDAVKFHMSNMLDGEEGKATITYVNTGVLSTEENAVKTAMDIFNGEKELVYGTDKVNNGYGHADWNGETIHLNKESLNYKDDSILAKYTSIMAKEGAIIDWNNEKGNSQLVEETLLAKGGEDAEAVLQDRFDREKFSYEVTADVMQKMKDELGIEVTDEEFKNTVALAADGRFSEAGVEWRTGQDHTTNCAYGKNPVTGYCNPKGVNVAELITKPFAWLAENVIGPGSKKLTEGVLAPGAEKLTKDVLEPAARKLTETVEKHVVDKFISPLSEKLANAKSMDDWHIKWTPPKALEVTKLDIPINIMLGSWNFAIDLAVVAEKHGKGELTKEKAGKEFAKLMGKRLWGHFEVMADNAGVNVKGVGLKDIKDKIKAEFEYTKEQIQIILDYNNGKIDKQEAMKKTKEIMKKRFTDMAHEGLKEYSTIYKTVAEKYDGYKKQYETAKETFEILAKKADPKYKEKKEELLKKMDEYKKKLGEWGKKKEESFAQNEYYKKLKDMAGDKLNKADEMLEKTLETMFLNGKDKEVKGK